MDVGCGNGETVLAVSKEGYDAVGLDLSIQLVRHAKEKAKTHAYPSLDFTLADAENLPFKEGVFYCVISFELIEHIPRIYDHLKEVKRVLSNDGILVLTTPNLWMRPLLFIIETLRLITPDFAYRRLTKSHLESYLRTTGFRNICSEPMFFFPHRNVLEKLEKSILRRIFQMLSLSLASVAMR